MLLGWTVFYSAPVLVLLLVQQLLFLVSFCDNKKVPTCRWKAALSLLDVAGSHWFRLQIGSQKKPTPPGILRSWISAHTGWAFTHNFCQKKCDVLRNLGSCLSSRKKPVFHFLIWIGTSGKCASLPSLESIEGDGDSENKWAISLSFW